MEGFDPFSLPYQVWWRGLNDRRRKTWRQILKIPRFALNGSPAASKSKLTLPRVTNCLPTWNYRSHNRNGELYRHLGRVLGGFGRKYVRFEHFVHRGPTLSRRTVYFGGELGIGVTNTPAKSHWAV